MPSRLDVSLIIPGVFKRNCTLPRRLRLKEESSKDGHQGAADRRKKAAGDSNQPNAAIFLQRVSRRRVQGNSQITADEQSGRAGKLSERIQEAHDGRCLLRAESL